MRVLIINYEMNKHSGVLAWQAQIAYELAKACESVVVLTERLGEFATRPNMHVEAVAKRPLGVPRRLGGLWFVNWQVYQLCRRYQIDVCFIHMAHDWSCRLYPSLRLLGIPVMLWYAHGTVSPQLRQAHRCVTRVVTSTPEGFRIASPKRRIIGQGINTHLFKIPEHAERGADLIYVGRVSRRKRIDLLLAVMNCLHRSVPESPIRLRVVGPLLTDDDIAYDAELRTQMWALGLQDKVDLVGFVPQQHTPHFYRTAFLHLNVSQTGSLDKTVLEALACGCPVLTSNEAFHALLTDYPEFIIQDDRPQMIAQQVLALYERREQYDRHGLRNLVAGTHDVSSYVHKLLTNLREICVVTDESTSKN